MNERTLYSILITDTTNHTSQLGPESYLDLADAQTAIRKLALEKLNSTMSENPKLELNITQEPKRETLSLSKQTIIFDVVETKLVKPTAPATK